MGDKVNSATSQLCKLVAVVSVLGLSLGVSVQPAAAKHVGSMSTGVTHVVSGHASNQWKWNTHTSNQWKYNTYTSHQQKCNTYTSHQQKCNTHTSNQWR